MVRRREGEERLTSPGLESSLSAMYRLIVSCASSASSPSSLYRSEIVCMKRYVKSGFIVTVDSSLGSQFSLSLSFCSVSLVIAGC
jgi:hypothetical protein